MTSEVDLVCAARDGDRRAFGALVERYERPIFSLAYRMLGNAEDAEDAAQESFLRAYRSLGSYDFHRPFSTWLLSIAAHFCIDRLRRRRAVVSLDELPTWRQVPGDGVDPEHAAETVDEGDRVQASLRALPDDYRAVLVLRYWHDLSYAEIAAMFGETESAIKSRLHRARLSMAELLARSAAPSAGGGAVSRAGAAEAAEGGGRPCHVTTLAG